MQMEEDVIQRGRRPRWIIPSEICITLYSLRKPNSLIALLFNQNDFWFKNKLEHACLLLLQEKEMQNHISAKKNIITTATTILSSFLLQSPPKPIMIRDMATKNLRRLMYSSFPN